MTSIEFSFTEVDAEAERDPGPQGCDACMHCHLVRTFMLNRIAEKSKQDRGIPAQPAKRGVDHARPSTVYAQPT